MIGEIYASRDNFLREKQVNLASSQKVTRAVIVFVLRNKKSALVLITLIFKQFPAAKLLTVKLNI